VEVADMVAEAADMTTVADTTAGEAMEVADTDMEEVGTMAAMEEDTMAAMEETAGIMADTAGDGTVATVLHGTFPFQYLYLCTATP
jgi:hypothetical protein